MFWVGLATITLALVFVAIQYGALTFLAAIAGLVLFELILRSPHLLRPGVFVVALLVGVAVVMAAPESINEREFYVVVAQVAPALFIALAVQVQGYFRHWPPGEDRRAPAIVVLSLAFAEYECLRVLACDDVRSGSFNGVAAAMAAAGVGLVLPVLLGQGDDADDSATATAGGAESVSSGSTPK